MWMLDKSMQIVLIKVSNVFACPILEKTKIIKQHEVHGRFKNAGENRHQYNAPSTIATDHHHTSGLNNGGKRRFVKPLK